MGRSDPGTGHGESYGASLRQFNIQHYPMPGRCLSISALARIDAQTMGPTATNSSTGSTSKAWRAESVHPAPWHGLLPLVSQIMHGLQDYMDVASMTVLDCASARMPSRCVPALSCERG
eukprot:56206-Pyramimonas_sp.AAC.1